MFDQLKKLLTAFQLVSSNSQKQEETYSPDQIKTGLTHLINNIAPDNGHHEEKRAIYLDVIDMLDINSPMTEKEINSLMLKMIDNMITAGYMSPEQERDINNHHTANSRTSLIISSHQQTLDNSL